MSQRKTLAKSGSPDLLQRLNPEEAVEVLRHLLEKHPELRSGAEQVRHRLPVFELYRRGRQRCLRPDHRY